VKSVVYRNANATLTVAKAECSAKLYLLSEAMLCNQTLKLFYNLARTLDVAGASDTYCNFHNLIPRIYIFLFFI
jgi:hypothetical protein